MHWVRTSDELPDENEPVLCYWLGETPCMARLRFHEGQYVWRLSQTHAMVPPRWWMRLELPTDDVALADWPPRWDENQRLIVPDGPPYESAMIAWNEFAIRVQLPKITKLTDRRKAAIRQRYRDIWPHMIECLDRIAGSDFLMGKVSNFRANFDWLWVRKDSHVRLLEGNFDNPKHKHAGHTKENVRRIADVTENILRDGA